MSLSSLEDCDEDDTVDILRTMLKNRKKYQMKYEHHFISAETGPVFRKKNRIVLWSVFNTLERRNREK